jgi:hypothetical protein
MTERVCALIAVRGGIRRPAAPQAIEYDHKRAHQIPVETAFTAGVEADGRTRGEHVAKRSRRDPGTDWTPSETGRSLAETLRSVIGVSMGAIL